MKARVLWGIRSSVANKASHIGSFGALSISCFEGLFWKWFQYINTSDFSCALAIIFPYRVLLYFIMIHKKKLGKNITHKYNNPCYVFIFWGCSCLFTFRFPRSSTFFSAFLHVHDLTASFFLHNCFSIHLIQPFVFFIFCFVFLLLKQIKRFLLSRQAIVSSYFHGLTLPSTLFTIHLLQLLCLYTWVCPCPLCVCVCMCVCVYVCMCACTRVRACVRMFIQGDLTCV